MTMTDDDDDHIDDDDDVDDDDDQNDDDDNEDYQIDDDVNDDDDDDQIDDDNDEIFPTQLKCCRPDPIPEDKAAPEECNGHKAGCIEKLRDWVKVRKWGGM